MCPRCPDRRGAGWTSRRFGSLYVADANSLVNAGVDGLILENFGDVPFYPGRVPPHTIAFLTRLATEVRSRFDVPLGINVLRNDGAAALAVAAAAGAEFIRVNVYTGARLADQGILEGEAHEIARYRKSIAPEVRIWADVAVKHSAALGERDLADEVEDTVERGLADAIIVSGAATGKPTSLHDVQAAKVAAGDAPVYIGSGATVSNVRDLLAIAAGVIIGSALKHGGVVSAPVDAARVRAFVAAARR